MIQRKSSTTHLGYAKLHTMIQGNIYFLKCMDAILLLASHTVNNGKGSCKYGKFFEKSQNSILKFLNKDVPYTTLKITKFDKL